MNFHKPYDNKKSFLGALEVTVRYTSDTPNQRDADLEKALSRFKKVLNREGLMQELKERQYFKSKGRKRYEDKKAAEYRNYVNQLKLERKRKKAHE